MEPTYGFPISIGAGGEMSLRVEDSKKLLVKLVGTESFLSREKLVSFFRAFLMSRVKTYIAQTLKSSKISIFEVDEHINEFSDELKEKLIPDFAEYGIALERFFVTRFVKPEGDTQYEKFKELHFRQYADIAEAKLRQQVGVIDQQTDAQRMVIQSQGIAQKRQIEGYTYQQERGFDVAEHLAQNEGAGSFSSAGIGLGMMAGVGGAVGSTVGGMFTDAFSGMQTATSPVQGNQFCEECGAKLIPGMAFCDECGHPVPKANCCMKCGYVFERPGKFCPKCGMKREG